MTKTPSATVTMTLTRLEGSATPMISYDCTCSAIGIPMAQMQAAAMELCASLQETYLNSDMREYEVSLKISAR